MPAHTVGRLITRTHTFISLTQATSLFPWNENYYEFVKFVHRGDIL